MFIGKGNKTEPGAEAGRFIPVLLAIGASVLLLLSPAILHATQIQKDVLTDQQTEDLRAHADQPEEKIKLYVGYIDERTVEIHRLATDPGAHITTAEIHNLYDEFTRLSDELVDNLDSYDQQHADLRKALKIVVDKGGKWSDALNEPKSNADYDFVRKTALNAFASMQDEAKQMLDEQTKYFASKKKEKKDSEKKSGATESVSKVCCATAIEGPA